MSKFKAQNKFKYQILNIKTKVLLFIICVLIFICHLAFAQENDLEFTLDVSSSAVPLPKVFKPGIDLSGRGFHQDPGWPQGLSAKEALDIWGKDIGFGGFYRLQYNLWEISQLSKDKDLQNTLLGNYEALIKKISDSGGVVILDIFGTPPGLGKVLDKKSPPWDLKAYKELVKGIIRELSCKKRYNIWYEVWSAPDLDDFFLGRKQEYFNLYRQVAESINELKKEAKIHIPLGGPSVSWWFQDLDGNTVLTAEKSLIYELIRFCRSYRLPLDFITWHGYSSDPRAEKESTLYKKNQITLIRDWLSYFKFDRNTPLIVDEWNFDLNANRLPERRENSYVCSSYIPARIKNMYEAGIDYQLYFSLEDFQTNKEGVIRNVGVFSYLPDNPGYNGIFKSTYNVFRMLKMLGKEMFPRKTEDDFIGVIATKSADSIVVLFYNYIDPQIVINYLSGSIATFSGGERKDILEIVKSDKLEKILSRTLDISTLRSSNKVKATFKKALDLNDKAGKFSVNPRSIKLWLKNLKGGYLYKRYTTDSSCSLNCEFLPLDEKEIEAQQGQHQETLELKPYSVNLLVIKQKTKQPENIETGDALQLPPGGAIAQVNQENKEGNVGKKE